LPDIEAELVALCWTVIAGCFGGPPPMRPGLALADRAWQIVRAGRRRDRRRQSRSCPLTVDVPADSGGGRPGLEMLSGGVSDAVRHGELGLRPSRSVYLTRVVGQSTVEAGELLGYQAGVLRAVRSRAERTLAA
jgi:hypothetical protein